LAPSLLTFSVSEIKQDYPPDTFSSSAALQIRQLERERRLREIERTFQNVVDQAQNSEDRIFENVFTDHNADGNGVHDEINISNMEHTIMEQQPKTKAGKLKEKALSRFYQEDIGLQFQVQSKDAAGNFDDFLPAADFNQRRASINTGAGAGDFNQRSHQRRASMSDYNQRRASYIENFDLDDLEEEPTKLRKARTFDNVLTAIWQHRNKVCMALLVFALIVATTVTANALAEPAIPITLSEETWDNLKAIRTELINQDVPSRPLSEYKSPQFTALVQLAEEVTMGELSIDSITAKLEATSETNYDGELTNFNDSYKERRIILERYVMFTLYYSTTSASKQWKTKDNWLDSKTNICAAWHGITCKEILGDDSISLQVVRNLNLASNQLLGTIPAELSKLYQLEELNLQDNFLSGPVPPSLGDLKSLKKFHFSRNVLSGAVPNSVCKLKVTGLLAEIVSDCGGGGANDFECDCCTECV
jgi:hypothetical protein